MLFIDPQKIPRKAREIICSPSFLMICRSLSPARKIPLIHNPAHQSWLEQIHPHFPQHKTGGQYGKRQIFSDILPHKPLLPAFLPNLSPIYGVFSDNVLPSQRPVSLRSAENFLFPALSDRKTFSGGSGFV